MVVDIGRTLALAAALSLDSVLAGAGLGCTGIGVSLRSALAAGCAGGGAVALAMAAGRLAQAFLPQSAAAAAGGAILLLVGGFKFFESSVKLFLKAAGGSRKLQFKLGGLGVLLDIYLMPAHADTDCSASLSAKEALVLGAVLAVDGAGAGLGAGLAGAAGLPAALACTGLGTMGLWLGAIAGKKAACPTLEPLGGLLLVALGLSRML